MDVELQRALQDLEFGIPGQNDPHSTNAHEVDNGPVRNLLADAACTVLLRSSAQEAYEYLRRYVSNPSLDGWFGSKRAELILEMLLYQTGWTSYSSWNFLRERKLQEHGQMPDARWSDVCSELQSGWVSQEYVLHGVRLREWSIASLAGELRDRLRGTSLP